MTSTTFSVPDVSCDHCKTSIEGAVAELDGVNRVEVNIEPKTVDVDFDEETVQAQAIVDAIEEQGYKVAG